MTRKTRKKNNVPPFTLEGITVKAGDSCHFDLNLPGLYTHSCMAMPVHIKHSKTAGPVMFISGAVHGDEINGVEIIRRVIKSKALRYLRGTLIAVPVVNVYGFVNKSRYLPDRRDLNRSFPGSAKGSMAGKLAHRFLHDIVSHCDYGIDLHTAAIGRDNLPQVRALVYQDETVMSMAKAFAAPVILNAELREGSLRQAASAFDTKILLYEAGEALRFDEVAIRAGVQGILNVMRHIGMLPKSRSKKTEVEAAIADSSTWIRAPQSGILRAIHPMGQRVRKGDVLGFVADPFGETEQEIPATVSGVIIGKSTLPLVHEGEAVFHIARFPEPDEAQDAVETFHNEIDPIENEGNEHVIF